MPSNYKKNHRCWLKYCLSDSDGAPYLENFEQCQRWDISVSTLRGFDAIFFVIFSTVIKTIKPGLMLKRMLNSEQICLWYILQMGVQTVLPLVFKFTLINA